MQGIMSRQATSNELVGKNDPNAVAVPDNFFPISPIVSATIAAWNTVSSNRPGGISAATIGKQTISARKANRSGSLRVSVTRLPTAKRTKTAT